MPTQKGATPILLLLAALGLLIFLFITSTFDFKNTLFSRLFPKPPSHAANLPIVFRSSSGEILPDNSSGIPITASTHIKIELTSTLGPPVATPSSSVSPTPESSSSASPIPSPSPTPTSSPTSSPQPETAGTVSYRVAESSVDLNNALYQPYTKEPTVIDYTFQASSLGSKFIWVEFKDYTGKTDRKSAQIELISPVSASSSSLSPSASPRPSPRLYPSPTLSPPNPTSTPIPIIPQVQKSTSPVAPPTTTVFTRPSFKLPELKEEPKPQPPKENPGIFGGFVKAVNSFNDNLVQTLLKLLQNFGLIKK